LVQQVARYGVGDQERLQGSQLAPEVILSNRAARNQDDARVGSARSQRQIMKMREVPRVVGHDRSTVT